MPMQTRTDQIHAWQFFLQRVVSSLVARESDPAELPYRRLGWSGFGGVMLAALVTAGFGVYGILVGGGATSWRDGAAPIVEKETGASYIYRDGRLHPMANFTSAALAVGNGEAVRVSRRSLEDVPRGPTLGIPGAPEALPDPGKLLTGAWSYCTQRHADGRGGQETVSVLGVGQEPGGGVELGGSSDGGGPGVLVLDVTGDRQELHLVWNGHRYWLPEPDPALRALGASRQRVLPVAASWLDTLPVGETLRPDLPPDLGEATAAFGDVDTDLRIGQVIESAGAFYLVRAEDLREISELQAELLLGTSGTRAAYPDAAPEVVAGTSTGLMARASVVALPAPAVHSAPRARPELATFSPEDTRSAALCTVYAPGETVPTVRAGARLSWEDRAVATPLRTAAGALLADRALIAGGHAALVHAMPAAGPAGSWHLVTDQGVRHALPSPEVAGMLGVDPGSAVRVPASLLARLPAGPALDPASAALPVATGEGA